MILRRIKTTLALLYGCCIALCSQTQYTISHSNTPFSEEGEIVYNQRILEESTIFIQKIQIDRDAITLAETITIQLESSINVQVTCTYTNTNSLDNYWYLVYTGDSADLYLSILNDNIQGFIYAHSGTYQIDTYGENDYVLIKMDMSTVPTDDYAIIDTIIDEEDKEDYYYEEDNLMVMESAASSVPIIRVLVLYTDAAERLLTTPDAVKNSIYTNINDANLSFINSGINARLRLAYIGKTTYTETTFDEALEHFWKKTDDYMNEVHTLRERYNADICVLLIGLTTSCGLSPVKPLAYKAFNVVSANSGCSSKFTFAHEIGHIMGCLHNTEEDDSNYPYKYGHGYVHYTGNPTASWRTMMAYSTTCDNYDYKCRRILYWSNPNISYNGVPTGDNTYRNNARVWNERAQTVSEFCLLYQDRVLTSSYYSSSSIYESIRTSLSITTQAGYHVETGQTVELESDMIQMLPGTEIKAGSNFLATTYIAEGNLPHFKSPSRNNEELTHTNNREFDIKISPNPAQDILQISSTEPIEIVAIHTLSGQKVLQTTATQIDVSSLATGMYIVRATSKTGRHYTAKIVKQ